VAVHEHVLREEYQFDGRSRVPIRKLVLPGGEKVVTTVGDAIPKFREGDPQSAFDYAFIRQHAFPELPSFSRKVSVVDLFSGCGSLSLGAMEACRALGIGFECIAAIDNDPEALQVFETNIPCRKTHPVDVNEILDGSLGQPPTAREHSLMREIGEVNLLLAGPPCQGNSNLNNHTRRTDPRNILYEKAARFVELFKPEHVLIENVPAVLRGREQSVQRSLALIRSMRYATDHWVVDLSTIGVPQRRKRHVLVASLRKKFSMRTIEDAHSVSNPRSVRWAIGDLEDEVPTGILSSPSRHTKENLRRIRYLHEKDLFDLPNRLRPLCHRNGGHSYGSMYGRIRLDEPAQTITSGFLSPGQGRYVHPTRPRTITPHEAARLQCFPDFFDFSRARTRSSLARMIGNAAPMKLSYIVCLELLA